MSYLFSDHVFVFKTLFQDASRKARTVSASDTLDVPSFHEGEKPMVVSPSWLPFFLPRPSDERRLLDLIFGVFTGARIRGGTKGRRRPKHLR